MVLVIKQDCVSVVQIHLQPLDGWIAQLAEQQLTARPFPMPTLARTFIWRCCAFTGRSSRSYSLARGSAFSRNDTFTEAEPDKRAGAAR